MSLGDLNTRDRDYGDLYRLLTLNDLDGQELTTALTATATHRGITLKPLSTTITDLGERRQTSYTAWRRRQGTAGKAPPQRATPDASRTSSGRSPPSRTHSSTARLSPSASSRIADPRRPGLAAHDSPRTPHAVPREDRAFPQTAPRWSGEVYRSPKWAILIYACGVGASPSRDRERSQRMQEKSPSQVRADMARTMNPISFRLPRPPR
ncbi:hypothetical protein [Streptomyces sp. A1277]|uniref:hypothetical protein n=1 Tax=Streptomyces sp. A1277 TaxID=2563103 RepID=UPI003211E438